MLDVQIDDAPATVPLLEDKTPRSSTSLNEEQILRPLALLWRYHLSTKTLQSRQDCLKKYFIMFLSTGGGLGYWSAVDKYNKNHQLSNFEADSNTTCVITVTSLFLLQSVDLARNYLKQLIGSVPPELDKIIEKVSAERRNFILLKTGFGSLLSGLPFFIIGLKDSLPFITKIPSDDFRKLALSGWSIYFYGVNVGLHILPFALLQTPAFDYYLWPFKKIHQGFAKCMPKKTSSQTDLELSLLQDQLQTYHNELRSLPANRIYSSMSVFLKQGDIEELKQIFEEISLGSDSLEPLLDLLRKYPPQPTPPAPSRCLQIFLRLFGAQLELGGAFIWWTNIFPTLYNLFKSRGMDIKLVVFLTTLLGLTPSYVLFVLLAFFGENQFPRLAYYIINAIKKLLGRPDTHPLLPPIAQARPILFGIGVLAITYMSYFAPINAKSLNEEQYEDILSSTMMMILNIFYANTGILIMAFISLLDFFTKYLTEGSAVFGRAQSSSQLQARWLITQENYYNDLMRSSPPLLIEELKTHNSSNNKDALNLLLGANKGFQWLLKMEKDIKEIERQIAQKKSSHTQSQTPIPLAQPKPPAGLLSCCYAVLFYIPNCFSRCFKKSNRTHTTSIQHTV